MSGNPLNVLVEIKTLASAAGISILDSVPDLAVYPRVTFGPETSEPWDAACTAGREGFLQIDVWSRVPGRVETATIMQTLYDAIHDKEIGPVLIQVDSTRTIRDPDGKTTHGIIRVRYITEQ